MNINCCVYFAPNELGSRVGRKPLASEDVLDSIRLMIGRNVNCPLYMYTNFSILCVWTIMLNYKFKIN